MNLMFPRLNRWFPCSRPLFTRVYNSELLRTTIVLPTYVTQLIEFFRLVRVTVYHTHVTPQYQKQIDDKNSSDLSRISEKKLLDMVFWSSPLVNSELNLVCRPGVARYVSATTSGLSYQKLCNLWNLTRVAVCILSCFKWIIFNSACSSRRCFVFVLKRRLLFQVCRLNVLDLSHRLTSLLTMANPVSIIIVCLFKLVMRKRRISRLIESNVWCCWRRQWSQRTYQCPAWLTRISSRRLKERIPNMNTPLRSKECLLVTLPLQWLQGIRGCFTMHKFSVGWLKHSTRSFIKYQKERHFSFKIAVVLVRNASVPAIEEKCNVVAWITSAITHASSSFLQITGSKLPW